MSRRLARVLRHNPERAGVALDAAGWAPLAAVAKGLGVTVAEVEAAVALPGKQRYEIDGERIRARYGHSVPDRVEQPIAVPPDVLFHGTTASAVPAILDRGLLPMGRQYVHLSADRETARAVGARRRERVVLLAVAAAEAYAAGVTFRDGGHPVWLADAVPAEYLRAE